MNSFSKTCFIFLYLAVTEAFSEEEVNMWVTGLNWLMTDTQRAPAPQQIDRFVYSLNRSTFLTMIC